MSEWGLDSGSENHLVSGALFDDDDYEMNSYQMARPLRLATANGVISADKRMKMYVGSIGLGIEPIVLDNTVNVLSLGRLILDHGFAFSWTDEGATLSKHGRVTECPLRGYVPMLTDFGPQVLPSSHMPVETIVIDDPEFLTPPS